MSRNWRLKQIPKILVIVGPTASGKSSLAIKIARKLNGEIVSADSRQIYRGMDIGTAKPKVTLSAKRPAYAEASAGKQALSGGITHHLINVKNPDQNYTVAEFKRDAVKAIRNILRRVKPRKASPRGKLPILVGGTGLYVKAVVDNLNIPKVKASPELRAKLEKELREKGLARLAEKLVNLDPEAAYIVDLKNQRRVIRALEVAIQTGKPFTSQRKKGKPLFDALQIGIKISPAELRKRINKRVDLMIENGLVDEVVRLLEKYGPVPVLTNTIGYREIINYFNDSGISINQPNRRKSALPQKVAEEIKQNTWAYAKRQMTWFKKDKRIKCIDAAAVEKTAAGLISKK